MHLTPSSDLPLLGAYAMAPADGAARAQFWAAVADLPIGGLELPLPAPGAPAEPALLAARDDLDLLVTCIPTVMGRLADDPAYGLASGDEDGRRRALDDVRRAADLAGTQAAAGGARVTAIQVHSAPGPRGGSRDALRRSLEEIVTWDLAGARLLVEHCDALVTGQVPAKGFLTLDEELAVLADLAGADGSGPALAVNWGRSAIEGRSLHTPLEHLRAARDAGLLGALVLSGATDATTAWGAPWADAHIPPRGDAPALAASADSLLGPDEIAAALALTTPGCLVAVKVAVRPADADVATRIEVARAALAQVTAAGAAR